MERLLPHLSAVAREVLGADAEDPRNLRAIPPKVRSGIAGKAGVGQVTVERFLRDETDLPENLEPMLAAIAEVADLTVMQLWQRALDQATDAAVGRVRPRPPKPRMNRES